MTAHVQARLLVLHQRPDDPDLVVVRPEMFLCRDRLDLVIKYGFFAALISGEMLAPTCDRYLWHIAKRYGREAVEDRWAAAHSLLCSMQAFGYLDAYPVEVDASMRLICGAHRVACALALGIDEIVMVRRERESRQTWGLDWFEAHGMPLADRMLLQRHYTALSEKLGVPS